MLLLHVLSLGVLAAFTTCTRKVQSAVITPQSRFRAPQTRS
jgi:hypothetical protein